MRQDEMKQLLEVGVLLSSERDINRLLEKILACVMNIARCDAGTLYLMDDNALRFRIMCNHTMKSYSGGDGQEPNLPPVPLTRESVCARAVLENRCIRIGDGRQCKEYDLTGPIRYDAMTGYHSQSMLVVPMRNREGEILGVLQLINAMDEAGNVQEFSEDMVLVLESVASQAAITIQNVRYIREIKELFRSFVRVMSSAVDERTPYNGSHTRHMAQYGDRFIDFLNARSEGMAFSPAQKDELLMSVWLHDIGKLRVPTDDIEEVNSGNQEDKQIRHHAEQGAEILERVYQNTPENSFLPMAIEIARYHHACWDGSGYPGGISGKDIPLSARITIVADNYDTLTGAEGQGETYSPLESLRIIKEGSGIYFDPDIVDVFLKIKNLLRHS